MFIFLYRLLWLILLPLLIIRLLLKSVNAADYRKRLLERLGFISVQKLNDESLIWLHCVSVGEFLAAKPIIDKILANGAYQLLITSTTPSGSAQVVKHYPQVLHVYLPFDITVFYRKIIYKLKPKICIIVETEIWPNLLLLLKKNNIPSMLINARLSVKSFKRYKRFKSFTTNIVSQITHIVAQNQQSYDYFAELRGNKEGLSLLANMKFDLNLNLNTNEYNDIKTLINNRLTILFASTHNNEEAQILSAYTKYNRPFADSLLVIAPRHPERSAEVIKLLKTYKFSYQLRSDSKKVMKKTEVLLVDTLGELLGFYALSTICFVGGSLVDKGGHNVLEAAGFAKAILFGKSVYNFSEVCLQLLQQNAALQVDNADDLMQKTQQLYNDKAKASALGKAAYSYFSANRGAVDKLYDLIVLYGTKF